MNVQTRQCDPSLIAGFLDRRQSESEQVALEEHLSECAACRASLRAQTADDELWEKASRYLRDDDGEAKPFPGMSDSTAECDRIHSVQHVLDALGPTDDPEMLGRLGGYEVSGVVGSGGMGVVLKALDQSLDRTVAIKVMAPYLASNGAARKRFAREAKAAAAVLHPNVMAIHSVSNGESLPFLVMPYMRGTSLQKRLDTDGPLPVREILRIASQTAAGLAAAHAQGLVHRDIKPANILLEEGVERVAITDFGLARAVDDASMTRTGVLAGTPQYMSPEQARGESVDQRTDLFSLGSVLYAMCTGRAPFRAESSYGVLRRITDEEPKSIREINPDIPEWLCRIIRKLMAKQPDERFDSAEEVAELLEGCLAHVQQPTTVPLPTSLWTKPKGSRYFSFSRRSIGAIVMLAALGLSILGLVLFQDSAPPDIAGRWTGEGWGQVVLEEKKAGQYEGTYNDTFGQEPGSLEFKWSRIEHRFKGTWREGNDRFGKISVRLVGDEIRGAWTTNKKSSINPGTPELADLLWTRAAKAQRGTTRIRVHANGKPVADNSVILGTEGYPGQFLPDLSETPSRWGVISLEKLAAGTHWLLVRDNNTVLRIQLPDEKEDVPPIDTSLPKYPSLIGKNVDVKVTVEVEDGVEFVVVEIHNRTEEHLLVTEANLQLLTAINNQEGDARVMSPLWSKVAAGKVIPETTIQPDRTATVRLNWKDWVRHGLWFSRDGEHITEPHFRFPDLEPGKTWVRVTLGSAPPVMVTHPDKIVDAREAKGASLGIPDATKLTGTWRGEKDGMTVELTFTSETEWRMSLSAGGIKTNTDRLVWKVDNETRSIILLEEPRQIGGPVRAFRGGASILFRLGELQDGESDTMQVNLRPQSYLGVMYKAVDGLVLERVATLPIGLREEQVELRNQELRDARDGEGSSMLEFHLAYVEPAEGLVEANGGGQRVYMEKRSFATLRDVAAVRLVDDASGKPAIELTFRAESAERVRTVTAQHLGKPVAVIWGLKGLLTAPTIREPFGEKAVITGQFTIDEAVNMYNAIGLAVQMTDAYLLEQSVSNIDAEPVWGETINGIQLAVAGISSDSHFKPGTTIRFCLQVRNAGSEPVVLRYQRPEMDRWNWTAPTVHRADGAPIDIYGVIHSGFSGEHKSVYLRLEPNGTGTLQIPGILVLGPPHRNNVWWPRIEPAEPGAFRLSASQSFEIIASDGQPVGEPFTLTSGSVNFHQDAGADAESQADSSGIRVRVLLDAKTYSQEVMQQNVGFEGFTLLAAGVAADDRQPEGSPVTVASRCRLESFEATEVDGKQYWKATIFLPQGSTVYKLNLSLTQDKIDELQERGAAFKIFPLSHEVESGLAGVVTEPVWGEIVNGLQLGISGIQDQQNITSGTTLRFNLLVRNVSSEPIRIRYFISKTGYWISPRIVTAEGEQVQRDVLGFRGGHTTHIKTLEPEAMTAIEAPGIIVLGESKTANQYWPKWPHPQPDQYKMDASFLFALVDNEDKLVGKSFTLTSGSVNLHIDATGASGSDDDVARPQSPLDSQPEKNQPAKPQPESSATDNRLILNSRSTSVLEGTWAFVSIEGGRPDGEGTKRTFEDGKERYVFEGKKLVLKTVDDDGKVRKTGEFDIAVDTKVNPHRLTLRTPEDRLPIRYIYEVKGDTLRMCFFALGEEDGMEVVAWPHEFSIDKNIEKYPTLQTLKRIDDMNGVGD